MQIFIGVEGSFSGGVVVAAALPTASSAVDTFTPSLRAHLVFILEQLTRCDKEETKPTRDYLRGGNSSNHLLRYVDKSKTKAQIGDSSEALYSY